MVPKNYEGDGKMLSLPSKNFLIIFYKENTFIK